MNVQFRRIRIALVIALLGISTIIALSCKDFGDTLSIARALTATAVSVNLGPGASQTVTISGGTPPYVMSQRPDTTVATAILTNLSSGTATLQITAVPFVLSADTTVIKIRDSEEDVMSDGPTRGQEISIQVIVRASPAVSFSAQVQPIFTANCVSAGCHPGGGAPFPLNSSSYINLINIQATSSCTSDKRVLPGNAPSSVLYRKIAGSTCGDRMPLSRTPLAQTEIDLIRDWINQGARNN